MNDFADQTFSRSLAALLVSWCFLIGVATAQMEMPQDLDAPMSLVPEVPDLQLPDPTLIPSDEELAPIGSSSELLELYGMAPSFFDYLEDGHDIDAVELETLLQMLSASQRFTDRQEREWTLPDTSAEGMWNEPTEHRGEMIRLRGRVTKITHIEPPPQVQTRFNLPKYYRCEMEIPTGQFFRRAIVYSHKVPNEWQQRTPPPGEWRSACVGYFLKKGDDQTLIFTAQRMAWYPLGLLGDLEMDVSLFEEVKSRSSSLPRKCFYELMSTLKGTQASTLLRQTRVFPNSELDFTAEHITDWYLLPYRIRLGSEVATPSPERRLWEQMPENLRAGLSGYLPNEMPSETVQEQLIRQLNQTLVSPEFYTADAFDSIFLNFEALALVEKGLKNISREKQQQFRKLLFQQIKARRKQKKGWGGSLAAPELRSLAEQGVKNMDPKHLRQFNRYLLEMAFPQSIAKTKPYSVVPLFNSPETERGKFLQIEGTARRCVRVEVTDPSVQEQYGIDHYYEMWVYPRNAQNHPVVCCVVDLPKRMPVGEEISQHVRVPGVFLQCWIYASVQTQRARVKRAERIKEAEAAGTPIEDLDLGPDPRKSVAPLMIGQAPVLLKNPYAVPNHSVQLGILAAVMMVTTVVLLSLWVWKYNHEDDQFQDTFMRHRYEPAVSLDDMGIEARDTTDFSFLNEESKSPAQ